MTEFINIILSFPTLLYTGLVVFTFVYWIVASFGFGLLDVDFGDGAESIGDGAGWLNRFKIEGIPVSISVTFIILFSWVISYVSVHYYQDKITDGLIEIFVGFWVAILAPLISAPIVNALFTPLKPLFRKIKEDGEGRKANSLIGHLAIIRTNKVTMNFGDAELDDAGANLIIKVRAEEPNGFTRGDTIMITDYNEEENTFRIRPTKRIKSD